MGFTQEDKEYLMEHLRRQSKVAHSETMNYNFPRKVRDAWAEEYNKLSNLILKIERM